MRDLRRHLGLVIDDPTPIAGDLRTLHWRLPSGVSADAAASAQQELQIDVADAKSFVASWAASRPDVMAAHSDVDVARANLCLASASRTPDLQVGPYYQRTADGTTFLGFRAQMDIPVVNSGRPLEQQRGAELGQRITAWQQALVRAELEAQAALARYQLAYAAVVEEGADEAASLPRELQNLESQFLEGEVDVVRVVQARTSIIQNQRVRLDLLNELAQSAAALTGATGIPFEEVLHTWSD